MHFAFWHSAFAFSLWIYIEWFGVCCIFWKALGISFSMFLLVSKLWRFSGPRCSRAHLATLGPFGPSRGGSLGWAFWGGSLGSLLWLHKTKLHCGSIVNSGACTPESCFRCRSIVNSAFWHSKIMFSLRISSDFCVLALRNHVFIVLLLWILRSGPLK